MTKEDLEDVLMEMPKDIVDERLDAVRKQTRASDIKGIIESFGVTIERAMDVLGIPESQRDTYAALVSQEAAATRDLSHP